MPAHDADQVLVYQYRYWDVRTGSFLESNVFATIISIRDGLGMPIYETATWVAAALLRDGIYDPTTGIEVPGKEHLPPESGSAL